MASTKLINAERRMVDTATRSSLAELFSPDRPWEDATVTCGTPRQRGVVFYHILHRAFIAGMPAIIFYSTDEIERQLRQYNGTVFLNPTRQRYMPLLGMSPQEAISALCPNGGGRDWAIAEAEALRQYLNLLPRLGIPVSLRHLLWLIRLDRDSFTAFVNASRLTDRERSAVLHDTSTYYGGSSPVVQLLCTRVESLGLAVAQEYIYDPDSMAVDCTSILTAIRSNSVLAIRLDPSAPSRSGMDLLCQELRIARTEGTTFLLSCCDLIIPEGSPLAGQLQVSGSGMTTFLSTDHAPNAFVSQRNDYWRGMLRGSLLVLHCGNPGTAASYEELFGTYQRIKTTKTRNYNRRALSVVGTYGNATIDSEETVPRIRQQTLCGNPRGGIFRAAGGYDRLLVIGDLGL